LFSGTDFGMKKFLTFLAKDYTGANKVLIIDPSLDVFGF